MKMDDNIEIFRFELADTWLIKGCTTVNSLLVTYLRVMLNHYLIILYVFFVDLP